MMKPPQMQPLTEPEIERLDTYLREQSGSYGMANLEMLDGFLSAVVVGPQMVLPSEWMPAALGESHQFADLAVAQEISILLMRLYNQIVTRVGHAPAGDLQALDDADLPFLLLPEDDDEIDLDATEPPVGAAWALGFRYGRELRADDWDGLCAEWEGLDEDLDEFESLLEGLGEDEPGPVLPLRERLEIIGAIPDLLHDLYSANLTPNSTDPPADPIRHETPKVGRNDPCPCGSGLKYKKCHGAN